jgi:hypothetical protein
VPGKGNDTVLSSRSRPPKRWKPRELAANSLSGKRGAAQFDSARYRTGDEKIMVLGLAWEREVNAKSDCHLRRPLRSPLVSARYIPGDGPASAHAEADTVEGHDAAAAANPVAKPLGNA